MQRAKMTRFYGMIGSSIYCDIAEHQKLGSGNGYKTSKVMGFEVNAVMTMNTKYNLTDLPEADRVKLSVEMDKFIESENAKTINRLKHRSEK